MTFPDAIRGLLSSQREANALNFPSFRPERRRKKIFVDRVREKRGLVQPGSDRRVALRSWEDEMALGRKGKDRAKHRPHFLILRFLGAAVTTTDKQGCHAASRLRTKRLKKRVS